MAETRRNYTGPALLALAALAAIGGLLYLGLRPQLQPTPAAPPPPAAASMAPPVFDIVRIDAQGNAVLAGRAAPGATITILDGNNVLGTVTADAQGAFVLVPANPLSAGAHSISLRETLPDGTQLASIASASVNVANGGTLTVLSGPNGSAVLSNQGPKPGTLGLGVVDYDANGHAIFSGTAPAGAQISVQLGNTLLGRTAADNTGRWRFTANVPATGGTLTLNATAANGVVLPPVSAPFALETLPNALAAGHVVITPGDNLWLIARHVYGKGTLYTVIYAANANQIHDPNLIFPGQGFALPKPKAGN